MNLLVRVFECKQDDHHPVGMNMRRLTRLTNAFSRKIENHPAAVALHFQFHNLARTHESLTTSTLATHAMMAGLDDQIWDLQEIAGLLD